MNKIIVALSLGDDLVKRIDEKRDDIPRSRFITRIIERALGVPEKERAKYD